MRRKLAIIATSAIAICAPASATDLPLDGLGIRVTNCVYDVLGVDVDFVTTNPPPYVAAVFVADEFSFNSRKMPIRAKVVNGKHACIAGDFTSRGNTFVQILMPSVTNDPAFHVLTTSETDEFFDRARASVDFSREVGDSSRCWSDSGEEMTPISDYTWGSFVPTTNASLRLKARGLKAVPDLPCDWETNQIIVTSGGNVMAVYDEGTSAVVSNRLPYVNGGWQGRNRGDKVVVRTWHNGGLVEGSERVVPSPWTGQPIVCGTYSPAGYRDVDACVEYNPHYPTDLGWHKSKAVNADVARQQTLGPFDTSVGLGLRVILDECTGRFRGERAYSLFADRSQECVLKRPFKALSAHNGKKYKLDWRGFVRIATETNAIPDKIYFEGL